VFPRWELLESRKESVSIAVADAEKVVSGRRESRKVTLACLEIFVFIKKTSIPPVNGLEAPKIKDSLIFIPPLIPPVISPISLPPVISSGVERSLHALRLVEMTHDALVIPNVKIRDYLGICHRLLRIYLQNGKKFCIFAPTKTRCGKRDDTTAEATA
jgi:hypothetical protein